MKWINTELSEVETGLIGAGYLKTRAYSSYPPPALYYIPARRLSEVFQTAT